MNIEDMLKNVDPKKLSEALAKMNGILSPQQMAQAEKEINSAKKDGGDGKFNNLNAADLQKELLNNPMIAKQLASNPELIEKISSMFKK